MTDRELMQQALENICGAKLCEINSMSSRNEMIRLLDKSITALRDRLAQPEQDPFEYWNAVEGWVKIDEVREHFKSVNCGTIYKKPGEGRVPLYAAPPQRPWVGLTDEDRQALAAEQHSWECLCSAVEAKLKEKNT
jgi:hypothetical protein